MILPHTLADARAAGPETYARYCHLLAVQRVAYRADHGLDIAHGALWCGSRLAVDDPDVAALAKAVNTARAVLAKVLAKIPENW